MEQKKITKKERFMELREIAQVMENEELVKFIDHEIELLNKKSASKSKADVAKAELNTELSTVIAEVLTNGKKMTATEIMKSNEVLAQYTVQKITSLLKTMVENGSIAKATEKGKSLFYLA